MIETEQPLVSIILPCYNMEKFLEHRVKSLLSMIISTKRL